MPHCSAVFWGKDLTVIHNLAWETARGGLDGQASNAHDTYEHEALASLKTVLRGRTVKVGKHHTVALQSPLLTLTLSPSRQVFPSIPVGKPRPAARP